MGDNTKARDRWTDNQILTLQEFIDAAVWLFPTIAWVGGHRDTGRATLCPGLDVRELIPGLPG